MDQFQATPSADVIEARKRSAIAFADILLREAIRSLVKEGGMEAVQDFRSRALKAVEDADVAEHMGEALRSFAVEEIERIIQEAADGQMKVPGWDSREPRTIEERKT